MTQRRYLVLLRMQPGQTRPEPSPEQMQQMFAAYETWKRTFEKQLLDLGSGLAADGRVVRSGSVADGPFIESKEIVTGYMIVGAEDYAGAVKVAQTCPPCQMPGCSLEVRELVMH